MTTEITPMWEETVAMRAYDRGLNPVWGEGSLSWGRGTLNMNSMMKMLERGSDMIELLGLLKGAFGSCVEKGLKWVEYGARRKKSPANVVLWDTVCTDFCKLLFISIYLISPELRSKNSHWSVPNFFFPRLLKIWFQRLFQSSTLKINFLCFSHKLAKNGLRLLS